MLNYKSSWTASPDSSSDHAVLEDLSTNKKRSYPYTVEVALSKKPCYSLNNKTTEGLPKDMTMKSVRPDRPVPTCFKCGMHGIPDVPKKGHKANCPFLKCTCEICITSKQRNEIDKQLRAARQLSRNGQSPSSSPDILPNLIPLSNTTAAKNHAPVVSSPTSMSFTSLPVLQVSSPPTVSSTNYLRTTASSIQNHQTSPPAYMQTINSLPHTSAVSQRYANDTIISNAPINTEPLKYRQADIGLTSLPPIKDIKIQRTPLNNGDAVHVSKLSQQELSCIDYLNNDAAFSDYHELLRAAEIHASNENLQHLQATPPEYTNVSRAIQQSRTTAHANPVITQSTPTMKVVSSRPEVVTHYLPSGSSLIHQSPDLSYGTPHKKEYALVNPTVQTNDSTINLPRLTLTNERYYGDHVTINNNIPMEQNSITQSLPSKHVRYVKPDTSNDLVTSTIPSPDLPLYQRSESAHIKVPVNHTNVVKQTAPVSTIEIQHSTPYTNASLNDQNVSRIEVRIINPPTENNPIGPAMQEQIINSVKSALAPKSSNSLPGNHSTVIANYVTVCPNNTSSVDLTNNNNNYYSNIEKQKTFSYIVNQQTKDQRQPSPHHLINTPTNSPNNSSLCSSTTGSISGQNGENLVVQDLRVRSNVNRNDSLYKEPVVNNYQDLCIDYSKSSTTTTSISNGHHTSNFERVLSC